MTKKHNEWLTESFPQELLESSLFRFNVKLSNGSELTVDMTKDIDINYEMLEEQCESIPSQYVFWAAVYSELRLVSTILERRVKSRRGVLIEQASQQATESKVKLTDAQLKSIIETDETLNSMEIKLALAQAKSGKLYHMVEAIKMKGELIRTLAGFKRLEKETQR